jgi:hypothetical protein
MLMTRLKNVSTMANIFSNLNRFIILAFALFLYSCEKKYVSKQEEIVFQEIQKQFNYPISIEMSDGAEEVLERVGECPHDYNLFIWQDKAKDTLGLAYEATCIADTIYKKALPFNKYESSVERIRILYEFGDIDALNNRIIRPGKSYIYYFPIKNNEVQKPPILK